MLPIQLKLKGIYSYQEEEQTIDFTRLTADKLFGIFGKVGSGKSTILEAIMLALYNKTERLEGHGATNYDLMNLQSNELSVEFIFKAGTPTKTYRFTIGTKRNRKQYAIVKSRTHNQYELDENTQEWIPKDINAVDVLKLSHENFKRAVIIPQGKFQEFLQLTDANRAAMMMKIFQLEKFDLQNNAKALAQQNNKKLTVLQTKLEELVVTPEEIKNTKQTIVGLNKQIADGEKTFEEKKAVLKQFDLLEDDFLELKKLKANKESLEPDNAKNDTFLKWSAKYYNCRELFWPSQIELKSKHKIREDFQGEIKVTEEKYTQILRDIELEEKAFAETKAKYETIDVLEKYQEEWTTALDIKNLELVIGQEEKVLKKLKHKNDLLLEEITEVKENLSNQKQLNQLVERQQIAEQLIKQFVKQLNRFEDDLSNAKKDHNTIDIECQGLLNGSDENDLLDRLDNSEEGRKLKKTFMELQEKKQKRTGFESLMGYQGSLIEETKKEKIRFEESDSNQNDFGEKDLNVLQQKLKKKIVDLENQLVDKELRLVENNQLIHSQQNSLQDKNITIKYKLAELEYLDLDKINGKEVGAINELLEDLSKGKKQYLEYESNLSQLKDQAEKSNSYLQTRQKDYKKTDKEYNDFRTVYKLNVAQSEFNDFATVKSYFQHDLAHVKAQRDDAERFRRKYSDVVAQIDAFQKKIGDAVYDIEAHEKTKQEVVDLKNQLDQIKSLLSVAEANLERFTKELKRKKELTKEYNILDIRQTNIRNIEGLLKGKGFVNYVSGLKLKDLTKAANSRFQRMTYNQLSLLLNDKNNFEIRDNLNGGALRSIKTLSGGQTFQASLSLAIALADIVNAHHGEQSDFFFLDEGFGSLDTESLHIVFQTLQSLRKENKIVGVISHVESLQEEISTFLSIKNTEKGSEIACSWE